MDFLKAYKLEVEMLCNEHCNKLGYVRDYLLRPGKLIRPNLFMDYLKNARKIDLNEQELNVAVAIEFLHLFLLVHDDIMDDDDIRMEASTIHAFYGHRHGHWKGAGIGIMVGDLLFSRAVKLFTESLSSKEVLRTVFETIDVTVQGQLEEYTLSPADFPGVDEILEFYDKKAALYSIYLPLALAYMEYSGENVREDYLRKLRDFSGHLGLAFQVFDDLSEFNLEKKQMAQNLCSDVIAGRVTPILNFVLNRVDKKMAEDWIEEWKNGDLSVETHDEIMALAKQLGAHEYAENLIKKHAEKAWGMLSELGLSGLPTIKYLQELLQKNNKRR